jgi:hypothetical protein
MEWDDDFDNGYADMDVGSSGSSPNQGKGSSEGGFDPMDITNPASAYFFLSDDAQDEISGKDLEKLKCQSCGHRFKGEIYDSCPKCESVFTEEVLSFMEDEDASQSPNMKCLDCGHLFSGESYDSCPDCFSTMTEEITEERDDEY